jgi:ribonucleoside-diphosphate reductase alpha chain
METNNMRVTKRNGELEEISFDKILTRIKKLGQEASIHINYQQLVMKVIGQLYDTISTTKIDELAAEQCASLSALNPDYGTLSGRIIVSNHQKKTQPLFSVVVDKLYNFYDIHNKHKPLLSDELKAFVDKYQTELDAMIDYNRDYLIDYFGFKTIERSYLFKIGHQIIERPQHMWMRVSVGIHGDVHNPKALELIKETYDLMSQKYFTHATPTLFNAGTPHPQMSSCYLLAMEDDSIDGIFNTLKDCANISKWAGGIGLHLHNIRAKGTHIQGTNGTSNGLVPMLRVFNNTARYVDQGGGKRSGSFAMYLEPWHPDVFDFLEMRKNHGDEELKGRDLFYALWIPDLFMERVKEKNGLWSLFCPHECPGLSDTYGTDFKTLYTQYELDGKARKTINARDLWFAILDSQMETGTPYMLYKDPANAKSNQKNIGVIKSSNLCVAPETLILTDNGHLEIQSLENQNVNVWNGTEWSNVTVRKTGEDQELIDVYTDDGSKLTCTPYHKFYIQENYSETSIIQVEASNLKPNDRLIKCAYPIIDGTDKMLHPYTHGFFCGDGTYSTLTSTQPEQECKYKAIEGHFFCKRHIDYETNDYLLNNSVIFQDNMICNAKSYCKKPIIYLYGVKQELIHHMNYISCTENHGRLVLQLPLDIAEKFSIPSHNCSIRDKLIWFAGYCDADGTISRNGDNEQLQVSSINYEFLKTVKLMLQTCGINPKIKLSQTRDKSYLPNGHGGYKYYDVKPVYRLLVTSCDLYDIMQVGFSPKRLRLVGNKPSRNASQFIKILKIENNNRIDDTFCFNEAKQHKGIFNGIITGQCTEILEYSDDKETAVCNLASIGLPSFVDETTKQFDYDKLHQVTKVVTNNLNTIIDANFYPTDKTRRSNLRHRPIGIGVQGLADTFMLLDIPFHSDEARTVNKLIFETIYHASLEKSNEISIERKNHICDSLASSLNNWDLAYVNSILQDNPERVGAYSTFINSPASHGILQFDMWNVLPSERYDWTQLKQSIMTYGIRNSLLVAPMPTASTSQILGFNECFEPFTSNLYSRSTLAGEFVVVNKYLIRELMQLGFWNEEIKNNIIANKGSIQQLSILSEHVRNKYKIVWEIPMKHVIDMSADRGPFICQSQSLNLWMEDPVYNKLTSMHFYAWEKGLKTGIYYLRRKAKHQAQQFTIEPQLNEKTGEEHDICEMCSA